MRSLSDFAATRAETLAKHESSVANQSQHHLMRESPSPDVCEASTLKDHGPLTDDLLAALLPPEHNQGFMKALYLFSFPCSLIRCYFHARIVLHKALCTVLSKCRSSFRGISQTLIVAFVLFLMSRMSQTVTSDNVLETRPPAITQVGSTNRPYIRAAALTRLATRRLVIILREPRARVVSMFADQRHLVSISLFFF